MDTAKRVSVSALRILTYTILIKAVISAVMLICAAVTSVALRSSSPDIPGIAVVYVIAQTAGFVNIIACVMCLVGICELSKHFIYTHRLMVAELITQCVLMLFVVVRIQLTVGHYEAIAGIINIIMLASTVVERLLIGAAFLFLMKGFGEALRESGETAVASSTEKLGAVYFLISTAAVALFVLSVVMGDNEALKVSSAIFLTKLILELLVYRRVSDAAFRIWRNFAFNIGG